MALKKTWLATALISWTAFALGSQKSPLVEAGVPQLKKVMIVIFENTNYADVIAQPFFASLVQQGASLTQMNAEVHPSQANYIALTSGSTNGVSGDSNQDVDAQNVVDLLEAQGKTWKVYAESYPGNCFQGARASTYARKHNPFISYKNIQNNPARCAKIVDAHELAQDIDRGTLPDYSFYVPDMNNDGHDTNVKFADQWYAREFGPRLKDPRFISDMTLITTFDESGSFTGNHIYTTFVGPLVKAGAVTSATYNHLSLLRTIEDGLKLGTLGKDDAKAKPIAGVWK